MSVIIEQHARIQDREPQTVLQYAPPQPRASRRDLVLGIIISFCMSIGSGALTFGLLVMNRQRDDHATLVAIGVSLLLLGLCLTLTMLWIRRHPR